MGLAPWRFTFFSLKQLPNVPNKTNPLITIPTLITAAALAFAPSLWIYGIQVKHSFSNGKPIHELSQLLTKYPDAEVAPADSNSYVLYFLRVAQVWVNGKLSFDAAVFMDLHHAGIDDSALVRSIRQCKVRTWITPKASPWMMISWYSGAVMFSDKLRQSFQQNYSMVEQGENFAVWQCRDNHQ